MAAPDDDSFVCPHCYSEVREDDDFCATCGEVLVEDIMCSEHEGRLAAGVCIVCATPYCSKCGSRVHDHFLCREHERFEIYEGMANVLDGINNTQLEFARSGLESEGLHPFIFSRRRTAMLMVPCQEVPQALEKLRELEFIKGEKLR